MKRKKYMLVTYRGNIFYLTDYSKFFPYKMKFRRYSLLNDYITSGLFDDYLIEIGFTAYIQCIIEGIS